MAKITRSSDAPEDFLKFTFASGTITFDSPTATVETDDPTVIDEALNNRHLVVEQDAPAAQPTAPDVYNRPENDIFSAHPSQATLDAAKHNQDAIAAANDAYNVVEYEPADPKTVAEDALKSLGVTDPQLPPVAEPTAPTETAPATPAPTQTAPTTSVAAPTTTSDETTKTGTAS